MIALIRQALRSLKKAPSYVLTIVGTLALGIGLNAAIFTVVDNVLLRPLGYHDADRIVALRTHFNDENRSIPRLGGDDYVDMARDVHGFEATAQYQSDDEGFAMDGDALYGGIATVSSGFTAVMGVQPMAGRLFRPGDHDDKDVLLSAAFVRDHFRSPAEALGRSITYSGAVYTVAGVLPEGFTFPGKTQAWFEQPVYPGNRTSYNNRVIAKRRAGVSAGALSAELASFSQGLSRTYFEDRNKSIETVSLQEALTGKIRPTLNLLMGSVAVILLIVCANVTHLQLVRGMHQLRSATIRTAMGASRTALAMRALVETVLLASAGAALAVVLAIPALRLLVHLAPEGTPRLVDVHLNLDVLVFSFLLSLVVMALAALLPVWRSWHIDPATVLRQDSARGTESRSSLRLRSGFIVAEVALTLTLSVAAILLARQFIAQSHQDLGFVPDRLLTLDTHSVAVIDPRAAAVAKKAYAKDASPEEKRAAQVQQQLLDEATLQRLRSTLDAVAATPGVEAVGAMSGAPMGFGGSSVGYAIKGRQVFTSGAKLPTASILPITPGLLPALGVKVLRGRDVTDQDRISSPAVVLINQELARQEFPGIDPVGQQITCGYDDNSKLLTIIGVVGNVRAESPASLPYPTFYPPVAQHGNRASDMQLIVRTRADPAAMAETLKNRLRTTHPEIAVKATTMQENIGVTQQAEQFRTTLFLLFAGVSILLAAVGMYGVTAYTVAQRRFEFALRFALGATRGEVLGMVLGKALAVAAVGIAVGVALSLGLLRIVSSVTGKLPDFDLPSYTLAALAVLCIALLATFLPARRAAAVEPMTLLRSE